MALQAHMTIDRLVVQGMANNQMALMPLEEAIQRHHQRINKNYKQMIGLFRRIQQKYELITSQGTVLGLDIKDGYRQ